MRRALVDAALGMWGERLFYPKGRKYGSAAQGLRIGMPGLLCGEQVRARLRALVQRAPEVVVKVAGGGRGMRAISEHLCYISRRGALALEDERGELALGPQALKDLGQEWRLAGAEIPWLSQRREAFQLMLSMPPATDPWAVLGAARDFARGEFTRNKFAMVLHEPSTDPRSTRAHVHLVVRAQGRDGQRLRPYMADLTRWRQAFAERLMERGIAASATWRQSRGEPYRAGTPWYHYVHQQECAPWSARLGQVSVATQVAVLQAWREVASALARSEDEQDRTLAAQTLDFVRAMPLVAAREALLQQREPSHLRPSVQQPAAERGRPQSPEPARHRSWTR
ncbi:Type IV secretory pathway, VirD2 component (Relaxase) [Burkholderiales bacterium]|nr:Type IV secretory pathway, VirD2 component (Relaxase) [Burkholderiales bacterium]